MFDSAPGVHDQDFQLYISMLEGLIVDRWSAAEYLRKKLPKDKKLLKSIEKIKQSLFPEKKVKMRLDPFFDPFCPFPFDPFSFSFRDPFSQANGISPSLLSVDAMFYVGYYSYINPY